MTRQVFTLEELQDATRIRTHFGWHRVLYVRGASVRICNPINGNEERVMLKHVLEFREERAA